MPSSKAIPELSHEVRVIAGRLSRLAEDEVVTHAELQSLVPGPPDRVKLRSRISSAARVVARENGFVIGSVRGVGYKRVATDSVPAILSEARVSCGRKIRRTTKAVMSAVAGKDLSDDARRTLYSELAIAGAMQLMTDEKSAAAVQKKVDTAKGEPPMRDVLKALMG